ncbi:hypothetical protein GDO81_028603 [Engystomops pustulosus]|uniref:Uncharacterized protein n=1 Tax=Engystomops pustulosus TaxID=76066 RepID=A0AAV6YWB5_ENGPU|nr:hypothetical protein GDO81_028603 [Engystomops pustulosus]
MDRTSGEVRAARRSLKVRGGCIGHLPSPYLQRKSPCAGSPHDSVGARSSVSRNGVHQAAGYHWVIHPSSESAKGRGRFF